MKRKIINEFIEWKNANELKLLLLTGSKGVGKTYLAYDFAKAFYSNILYLNFERDPRALTLFTSTEVNLFTQNILQHFDLETEISSEETILILDEIAFCPNVIEVIKSLQQNGFFKHIIAISSNPVGLSLVSIQYTQFTLHPLDFDEFLRATSNEWYIETILYHFHSNKKIPDIVHTELIALFELYLHIGGMPNVINEYFNITSEINIAEQHMLLESSYHNYINKNNSDSDALKINQVYDIITQQLMKNNKKFQYKLIRKGTTQAMYKDAIQYLVDHNLVIKCNKYSFDLLNLKEDQPLQVNTPELTTNSSFKLYMQDVGMLYSNVIGTKDLQFNMATKKGLVENYVAQALYTNGYDIRFWESDSMAKIDFIIQIGSDIIPIEVHLNDNTRSKSISILKQKCDFPYAIKISTKNFEFTNNIKYVPYYAVFCL